MSHHSSAQPTSYHGAYNLCTPVAHQLTQQKCHYAQLYERSYEACMRGYGYDGEVTTDPHFYEKYTQAYQSCASAATLRSKEQCQYGQLYKQYYHSCMLQYGFNEYGEKVVIPDQKPHFHYDF